MQQHIAIGIYGKRVTIGSKLCTEMQIIDCWSKIKITEKEIYLTYLISWCEFFNFIEGDVYTHDTKNQLILQ